MPIGYKDFFPEVLKSGFFSTEYEALQSTVTRANQWITETRVQVINLETVVLPNIDSAEEASEPGLYTGGKSGSEWYQVIRVWYQIEKPAA